MKEIGGFLEWETYTGQEYYPAAIALNSGRSALRYLIRSRKITSVLLPRLLCDSIAAACENEGAEVAYYPVAENLRPVLAQPLRAGQWLYLINFYGQYTAQEIRAYAEQYERVIVDNTHAFFTKPQPGLDTLYTCRKFFGVPDGGYLCSDCTRLEGLETDESYQRLEYLMGRYERTANEFYRAYQEHEEQFEAMPVRQMSKATHNLLRGIDYARVKQTRERNFAALHKALGKVNNLQLNQPEGPYMYPLLIENGAAVRKKLQTEKIYIPTLWPNVLQDLPESAVEHCLAANILPLPVDQRYTAEDMECVARRVLYHIQAAK